MTENMWENRVKKKKNQISFKFQFEKLKKFIKTKMKT